MASTAETKSCLHLVMRSSIDALQRCYAVSGEHDEVLFIDDAVMFLVSDPEKTLRRAPASPVFLEADLQARGLAKIANEMGVRTLKDRDFVGLLRKHDICLTWK